MIGASKVFAAQPNAVPVFAGRVGPANDDDLSIFDFNAPLQALPAALQALNAQFSRASVKNVMQNGALVQVAANTFATEYDSVTGLYGYVPESAATNLATYSDGAASTYTVSNVTDAGTTITGFTASLAVGNNSVQRSATKAISVTSAAVYSISFFVVMDDGLGAGR